MGLAKLYNSYNDAALLSIVSNTFQLQSIKAAADQSSHFASLNTYLDELYDLEKDPYELKNLIGSPSHAAVRKTLQRDLKRLIAEATGL